jgi:hypothetical protein
MQTFIVECYWPGMTEEAARDTLDRVARAAPEASPGEAVRPLGCMLVPSDGMALYFFMAPSGAAARRMGSRAELPFDRIVECVRVGFDRSGPDVATRRGADPM